MFVVIPYGTDIQVETIGNAHLHKHTPQYTTETRKEHVAGEQPTLLELLQKRLGTVYRTGENCGEECYEIGKIKNIGLVIDFSMIDVERIAHEFECEKAQTDRNYDMCCSP